MPFLFGLDGTSEVANSEAKKFLLLIEFRIVRSSKSTTLMLREERAAAEPAAAAAAVAAVGCAVRAMSDLILVVGNCEMWEVGRSKKGTGEKCGAGRDGERRGGAGETRGVQIAP